jgi:hypothetical protein
MVCLADIRKVLANLSLLNFSMVVEHHEYRNKVQYVESFILFFLESCSSSTPTTTTKSTHKTTYFVYKWANMGPLYV